MHAFLDRIGAAVGSPVMLFSADAPRTSKVRHTRCASISSMPKTLGPFHRVTHPRHSKMDWLIGGRLELDIIIAHLASVGWCGMLCNRKWISRERRTARWIEALVHCCDGRAIPVILANVSRGGCRLRSNEDFGIDERIRIELPRFGEIQARVRWAQDGNVGVEFTSTAQFDLLR